MSIHERIIDAIDGWDAVDGPLDWPEARFDELANKVFAHQYGNNEPYRDFCDRRGVTPADEPGAIGIPAVPTDAFKRVRLFCDEAEPKRTFRTSGTTGDARGAHHFRTLEVYERALHPPFRRFCNPRGRTLRFLALAPSFGDVPESSLSFMLGELVEAYGDGESGFFVGIDGGEWRIDVEDIAEAIDEARTDGEPVLLFGTAFAYAELFERVDRDLSLCDGSVVVETGGFKGRFRQMTREGLYEQFCERFGVELQTRRERSAPPRAMSEYGMTELSSQCYTDEIAGGDRASGLLYAPPWLDVRIVDPVSLEPVGESGRAGLIRFVDLANVDSVSAIQTSDRGVLHADGGLELLGRAEGAELRGCSLLIEEITS